MKLYNYRCKVRSVYDGDSFRGDVSLGFGVIDHGDSGKGMSFRLHGIDTPEVSGYQKEAGKVVRDYVRGFMKVGEMMNIETIKDSSGKYGRYLAIVFLEDGINLNKHLVEKGFAKEYFGGTREKWTEEELSFIINQRTALT